MMKLESMNESQTGEKIREQSEFIRQAESFARYAHEEWVRPEAMERSMLISCVDRTVSGGAGVMMVCTGNRELTAHAVNTMMESEELSDIFAKARRISEMKEDWLERISQEKKNLRTHYIGVGVCGGWTLCLIALWLFADTSIITTASSLLLMGYIFFMLWRNIKDCRRRIAKYTAADKRQKKAVLEEVRDGVRKLMNMVINRDDDDEEDEDDE